MIQHLSKDLHSERLELKHLSPTMQNAELIYEALKNETPDDYRYEPLSSQNVLPQSVSETLHMMKQYEDLTQDNGCVFYMFYNNKFIGVRRLFFFKETNTLKFATVWLVSSARNKGFAWESFLLLEKIAFNNLKVNRLTRVNIADNEDSTRLAKNTGFILDGVSRQAVSINDGKLYDLMFWSKLRTDYLDKKDKNNENQVFK